MSEVLIYLVCFLLFSVLQSWFINGVKELYNQDMFLYKFRLFIDKHLKEFWRKPVYSCIRCMSSLYGIITFAPTTIYIFGLRWELIPACIFNIVILIFLNYFFYKRQ